jgi:hypothetical protein
MNGLVFYCRSVFVIKPDWALPRPLSHSPHVIPSTMLRCRLSVLDFSVSRTMNKTHLCCSHISQPVAFCHSNTKQTKTQRPSFCR